MRAPRIGSRLLFSAATAKPFRPIHSNASGEWFIVCMAVAALGTSRKAEHKYGFSFTNKYMHWVLYLFLFLFVFRKQKKRSRREKRSEGMVGRRESEREGKMCVISVCRSVVSGHTFGAPHERRTFSFLLTATSRLLPSRSLSAPLALAFFCSGSARLLSHFHVFLCSGLLFPSPSAPRPGGLHLACTRRAVPWKCAK